MLTAGFRPVDEFSAQRNNSTGSGPHSSYADYADHDVTRWPAGTWAACPDCL